MRKKLNSPGFTLVELLVVIAVLSVLAAGIMFALNPSKRFKQANDARIKADMNQIANALGAYFTINRRYPTAAEGLDALVLDQDLRTIPLPPSNGAASYSYADNSSCSLSPYTGCEAVLYYLLRDPKVSGDVWCWRSATGLMTETAAPPADCNP